MRYSSSLATSYSTVHREQKGIDECFLLLELWVNVLAKI